MKLKFGYYLKHIIMENIKTEDLVDISTYEKALKSHDWYYYMSKDPSIFEAGRFNHNRLIRLTSQSEEHRKLFNKYRELNKL